MADTNRRGITTLRQRYIQAYEKNVKVRQELDQLQRSDGEKIHTASARSDVRSNAGSYIQLLRQRRRHEECQTLHRHVQKLSETLAAQPRFLDINISGADLVDQRLDNDGGASSLENPHHESVEALTERLERAVVKAKHRLEYERQLLEQINNQHQTPSPNPSQGQRLQGLTAVQLELFSWIEEKLASSTEAESNDEEFLTRSDSRIENEAHEQASVADIESQYADYLKARQRLLDAVNLLSNPVEDGQSATGIRPSTAPEQGPPTNIQPILTFIEQQLIPKDHANQDAKMKPALVSAMLKDSNKQTLQDLDRLADESHLLSAYPVQPQSRKQRTDPDVPHEISDRTHAWCAASEQASQATEAFMTEHIQQGTGSLDQADSNISKLQDLTGDLPEEQAGAENEEEEDIWAGEIQQKLQQTRKAGRSAGPWTRLNGRVDLDDRKAKT